MRNVILSLLLLSAFPGFSQQVAKSLTASNGVFIGFYEFKPTDYTPTKKYPLIVFMHGIGERGNGTSELSRVKAQGIPKYISYGHKMTFTWNGKTETFLVLSPQLSSSYGSWPSFYAEEMIKYAKTNLSIDTNRIFVTGLSLGGGGTWKYAITSLNNSKAIAGLAPVCGTQQSGDFCNIAKANLPVWAFHSENDATVSVMATKNQINAVNNCNPAVKPLMSIWPTGGHTMWDRAYDTVYKWQSPNIFEWFLAQNKSLPVNRLPIANAGNNQATAINTTITLSAENSIDYDGKLVRYIWRQVSGPVSTNILNDTSSVATTQVTGFSTTGIYTYELKVVDDRAAIATATVNVTVGINSAPYVNAGPDVTYSTNDNIDLIGTASDKDGSIVSQSWSQVSGPVNVYLNNSTSLHAVFSTSTPGNYIFKLQARDNAGATSEDQVNITVTLPPNIAPIANAGKDTSYNIDKNAILNGSQSYDKDGSIVSQNWAQISGPSMVSITNSTSLNASFNTTLTGTYQFKLEVKDNAGAVSSDTVTLNIIPAINIPPVAIAGADQIITSSNANLDGSASYDDKKINTWRWKQVSGPSTVVISSTTTPTTQVSGLIPGIYKFRLRVWDSELVLAYDDVVITVKDNGALTNQDDVAIIVNDSSVNQAPIARAGNDVNIATTSVTVDGSSSTDDKGITMKTWSQLSGPNTSVIGARDQFRTTISNLIPGIYRFRLRVWDAEGVIDTDDVYVTVSSTTTSTPGGTTSETNTSTVSAESVVINPNPAIGTYAYMKGNSATNGSTTISVYTLGGTLLKRFTYNKTTTNFSYNINISNLSRGTYIAEAVIGGSKRLTTTFGRL
jgi:predicted esterase